MRFLSLFSGIEAASVAWKPLGWECVGVAEIEPFPCKVLKHHYPQVPNLGSVTKITKEQIKALGHIDLVVGGFPCQDLSVAGKRKGLKNDDGTNTRSGLFYDAMRLVQWSGARYLLLENVPGMFSSNKGRDFASVVGELLGCEFDVPRDGWQNSGVAASEVGLVEWATLDAQFFGVAQRRRRVFIVRDTGDWASRPPIFLERDSLCGNPAPSREKGQEVAGTIGARTCRSIGAQDADCGHLIGWSAEIAPTLNASFGSKQGLEDQHIRGGQDCSFQVAKCLITKTRMDAETETLIPTTGGHFSYTLAGNTIGRKPENGGNGSGYDRETMYTLTKTDLHGVCYPMNTQVITRHEALGHGTGFGLGLPNDPAFTLSKAHSHAVAVTPFDVAGTMLSRNTSGGFSSSIDHAAGGYMALQSMQVRRLTPVECERLQGFRDGYTDIKPKGKATPDGPRYKALGNSMAVPVMAWIGKRIAEVEKI